MIALLATWGYIYTGQAIAFSICILLIGKMDRHKSLWLISNVIGASGVYLASREPALLAVDTGMQAAWLILLSANLKALSLGDGKVTWKRNRIGVILVILAMALGTTGFFVPVDSRLFFIMSGGFSVNLASIVRLQKSRRWRGAMARSLMIAALVIAACSTSMRLLTAYPLGEDQMFAGTSNSQTASMLAVIALSFFMQVAFIGMLQARLARVQLLTNRRSVRISERAANLNKAKVETDKLAAERLNMLQLLTHEVRQPLNNAQATIEAINMQLASPGTKPQMIRSVIRRTENVLDEITLTLSNAITGATLMERQEITSLEPVEVVAICRLAIMDCPSHDRERIAFLHPDQDVFAHCDPVLTRLALRNLLDNAIKYSPSGTEVHFTLDFDEDALGLRFRIHNQLADLQSLHGNIFERGKRGVDREYDGFGLGLFVAGETARIHFGQLTFYQSQPNEVVFELFLPL